jgi:hypothetical protein
MKKVLTFSVTSTCRNGFVTPNGAVAPETELGKDHTTEFDAAVELKPEPL